MSTALVLSGGGARGIGHVAALEVIVEQTDLLSDLTHVIGTSAGSIVGGKLAEAGRDSAKQKRSLEVLDMVWRRLSFGDVYSRGLGGFASAYLRSRFWGDPPRGVYKTGGLKDLLKKHLPEPSGLDVTFWPLRWNLSQQRREFHEPKGKEEMVAMTLASASIPIWSEPVEWDGDLYVDGGVADITPLKLLVEAGVERAVVINLQSRDTALDGSSPSAFPDVTREVVEAVTAEIFQGDLTTFRLRNVLATHSVEDPYLNAVPMEVEATVISPSEPLPSGTDFSRSAKGKTRRVMRAAALNAT